MAEKEKTSDEESTLKPEETEEPKEKFVTVKQFSKFTSDLKEMLKEIAKPAAPQTPSEKKEQESIQEAGPGLGEINLRYDAKCRAVLGDYVERTSVTYPKGGGTLFNIFIKKDKSNAPSDYLERMKDDVRTINLEREEFRGEEGVERWSKLVLQNLTRNKR